MGTAIPAVEQNVSRALSLVQRAYVLESGNVDHARYQHRAANKQAGAGGVSGDLVNTTASWFEKRASAPSHEGLRPLLRSAKRRLEDESPDLNQLTAVRFGRRFRTSVETHPSASSIREPHRIAADFDLASRRQLPGTSQLGDDFSSSTPRASRKGGIGIGRLRAGDIRQRAVLQIENKTVVGVG